MQHDHDVGPYLQRLPVAALLVSTISLVHFMLYDVLYPKCLPYLYGIIRAVIIYQHHIIHYFKRNFLVGTFQGYGRIISR